MRHPIFTTIVCGSVLLMASACDRRSNEPPAQDTPDTVRIATFNVAMGLGEAGAMATALQAGDDPRLVALALVLQSLRPDVVLLNEFDYDPAIDAARLLQQNYLGVAQDGQVAIEYPHAYRPPVNTGVDSGLDLDGNGEPGEPGDAWGYGVFPGQYGMLILSRFPLDEGAARTFQTFSWSRMPGALQPTTGDGRAYYPVETWQALRLSSKNHLDLPIDLGTRTVHLLASHPTPPVFDGPEDRNGMRNHDELALWRHYLTEPGPGWLIDDQGRAGGLETGAAFLIAGDLNADPVDGDAHPDAIRQLLDHPAVDAGCIPTSEGGVEAARIQGGVNLQHDGDPAADTADFNDERVGNYRLDYVLPSRNLRVIDCGVFWPPTGSPLHEAGTFSDHRLVWIDIAP